MSLVLSLLVMLSTLSFTINKHYCGGQLVDASILIEAHKCEGMDSDDKTYVKKPCCEDTIDVIEGQDELKASDLENMACEQQIILAAFVYSYTLYFESLPKPLVPHRGYSPPNLIADIQVINETFLI